MSSSIVRNLRDQILTTISRAPLVRRSLVRGYAYRQARRGADQKLVNDAISNDDRPLDRTFQLLQWSGAIASGGTRPTSFSPGDHLTDAQSRSAAADAIRRVTSPDASLQAQLLQVDDSLSPAGLATAAKGILEARLAARSVTPKNGDGLDPGLQQSICHELTLALTHVGISPFFMSGTLLGLIRNGELLRHDYDIDLGLLPGTDLANVRHVVGALNDFELTDRSGWLVATHTSGISVDLFPHFERDGLFWHNTAIHEWWNTPFELEQRHFGDADIWVPSPPERYLDENFGRWDKPVAFYEISFDTPNRRYTQSPETLRFLTHLCLRSIDNGDRWTLESAARALRDHFGVDITSYLAASLLIPEPASNGNDSVR